MPIVVVFKFPGEDIAVYHKVFEVAPPSLLEQPKRWSHVCFTTDDGFTVVDVWEDEASFAAFGEIIGPALAEVGAKGGTPEIYPLVGTVSQAGKRETY